MKIPKNIAGMALSLIIGITVPASGLAEDTMKLYLRPHCESVSCQTYFEESPSTVKTALLKRGDVLDMDLVINVSGQKIKRIRTWLSYDPVVLDGLDLVINQTALPIINNEESDFSPSEGYVKLEISAAESASVISQPDLVIARISFKVNDASLPAGTAISFYDVREGGHTEVIGLDAAEQEVPLLDIVPSAIHVLFADTSDLTAVENSEETDLGETDSTETGLNNQSNQENNILQQLPGITGSASSNSDRPAEQSGLTNEKIPDSIFKVLQVQNVRITTAGGNVYLDWDPLPSDFIKAYNIYYGTVSGEYLHRRTIDATSSDFTKRALPLETVYYFAIRAVNDLDQESAFSQEVVIKVGIPESSNQPLMVSWQTGQPLPQTINDTNAGSFFQAQYAGTNYQNIVTAVPGATGISSTLILIVIIAALTGAFFAFRRQMVVIK